MIFITIGIIGAFLYWYRKRKYKEEERVRMQTFKNKNKIGDLEWK